jgi:hypothetical protein
MFLHDLTAELDYAVDWTDWLDIGETIATSTWSVPLPLVKMSDSISGKLAVVWIKATPGSTPNSKPVTVSNTITTNQGRKDRRSFLLSLTVL